MKIKPSLAIVLVLIAILLGGAYFLYKNPKTESQSADYNGAYQTKNHISEDAAITALNAGNVEAQASFGDVRIYLKNSHQWFIISGDGKKYLEAKAACGQKCWLIPQVVP